ncbi:MAG: hypothetical protein KJZ86_17330 [Caldilineaceae bacterium]|nr:hypothetical protein [Caldilineaceae bacterium]HRJ44024.1 hypothetical protein [Caldilineaceae bacterium]
MFHVTVVGHTQQDISPTPIINRERIAPVASVASKPHLIASLNLLIARAADGEQLTSEQIADILCQMAQTHENDIKNHQEWIKPIGLRNRRTVAQ